MVVDEIYRSLRFCDAFIKNFGEKHPHDSSNFNMEHIMKETERYGQPRLL